MSAAAASCSTASPRSTASAATANGAFYVFADISSFGLSSVEFCNRLLDEQKVVCIPGSAFGECGEGFIRIAYTCSDDNLREALRRIDTFCKSL